MILLEGPVRIHDIDSLKRKLVELIRRAFKISAGAFSFNLRPYSKRKYSAIFSFDN